MSQHRWQIGIVSLGIAALFLAAGCTSTDFIDSGNSIVSFELVAVGAGSQSFDCVQWGLGELKLRPLDGLCGADSLNAGDPCLGTTDCVPKPGETGTCLNSEANELIGNDGILVPASPEPGNILDLTTFRQVTPYDAVFCRNVLIYFSEEALRTVIENFAQVVRPEGLLFLGHSESIIGLTKAFQAERLSQCIAYRRVAT